MEIPPVRPFAPREQVVWLNVGMQLSFAGHT
jgi:hypothetical protein